jgi:hypothetical protein
VDGQSHVVHSEEEALGTRLTIDSLTCLLANETDPSKLLAISPGKLMRYLVPDESHVEPDEPYAEIEVGLPVSAMVCLSWASWQFVTQPEQAPMSWVKITFFAPCVTPATFQQQLSLISAKWGGSFAPSNARRS